MRIDTITTTEELYLLADRWNGLLSKSRANTIFLTWEWISTWWASFGDCYFIRTLVAYEGPEERMVGIAPFMIKAGIISRLLVIGNPLVAADHLDFIVLNGFDDQVARAFLETLRAMPGWTVCEVSGIRPDSLMARQLPALARTWAIHRHSVVAPYLNLSHSSSQFLEIVSRRFSRSLKRHARKLERDHPGCTSVVRIEKEADLDQAMTVLFDLHQRVKRYYGLTGTFTDQRCIRFHREIARIFLRQNWLDLYQLRVNQEIIASMYCYRYCGDVYYYQTGYSLTWSSYSPGQQLITQVIRAAIEEGMQRFDFLRGGEAYKAHWTNTAVNGLTLYIPRGPLGHLWVLAYRLARRINSWKKDIFALQAGSDRYLWR